MPQTFVLPQHIQGSRFRVEGSEARHLIHVLRAKPGEHIDLFDGQGRRYRGKIETVSAKESLLQGAILENVVSLQRSREIHLFQGLPKGSKFDYVLEKATELGVDVVIPFLSEKNPIKLTPSQAQSKPNRWSKVALAAAKQSNRADIPVIEAPRSLFELGDRFRAGATLVLNQKDMPIKKYLHQLSPDKKLINMVVGPESGFSPVELDWLRNQGAAVVSLGELTLRTETAGLAALAILHYEWNL